MRIMNLDIRKVVKSNVKHAKLIKNRYKPYVVLSYPLNPLIPYADYFQIIYLVQLFS